MKNELRFKLGSHFLPIPQAIWHREVGKEARGCGQAYGALSSEQQRVRAHIVAALPRHPEGLSATTLSEQLDLPVDRLRGILNELNRGKFFVALDDTNTVTWAYPVTIDATPHQLTFKTGERMTAA
jgi:hypothetical protein